MNTPDSLSAFKRTLELSDIVRSGKFTRKDLEFMLRCAKYQEYPCIDQVDSTALPFFGEDVSGVVDKYQHPNGS